jgi:hypothetical protein
VAAVVDAFDHHTTEFRQLAEEWLEQPWCSMAKELGHGGEAMVLPKGDFHTARPVPSFSNCRFLGDEHDWLYSELLGHVCGRGFHDSILAERTSVDRSHDGCSLHAPFR